MTSIWRQSLKVGNADENEILLTNLDWYLAKFGKISRRDEGKSMIFLRCEVIANVLKCICGNSVRFFSKKVTPEEGIMRILNVAEKNDAAKNIANFLSGGSSHRREGLSKFNKIYEFNFTYNGQPSKMIMTSVSGHLLTYAFTGHYKGWNMCSPEELFSAPVVKVCPEDYQPIQNTIKREVRSCDILIIWTDCDREGENIGYEIIKVCREVKPNLPVFRARFSEITNRSVRNAIDRLEQPNKLVSDAVDVRSELDLRIGAAFTRFQTLRLKRVFPTELGDRLISYGSCQFPTMGFVVQRYKEVQDFVPEPFWKLKVTHKIDDLSVEFLWKRVRLFDESCCRVLHERCNEQPLAKVESVETKPKSKWRPVPLDTIELEKASNRYLKLSAKETMKIAEKLYSQGYVSYPRTETNIFPQNMDLVSLVDAHTGDSRWGQFASQVIRDGVNPRQGKKSDQAHPPIHPIKHTDALSCNERKVYEFIVRRFLACVSKDAEAFETVVKIDVHDEKFVASGLQIVASNYLEVYPYEKWTAKEIHVYRQRQTFNPTSIDMVDGITTGPNLLTEAELIALMDKHGIGTDATHAEHIDKIQERAYVGLIDERYFTPGALGLGLVDGYDSMGFEMSKPYLRAELESDLKRICDGLKDPKVVLREQISKYRDVFKKTVQRANKLDIALSKCLSVQPQAVENDIRAAIESQPQFVLKCSLCASGMMLKHREQNSSFISCCAFPACRNAIWLPSKVVQVQVASDTCPQCGPDVRLLKFKFRPGSMAPHYPDTHTGCVGGCDDQFMQMLEIYRFARRDAGDVVTSSSNSATTRPANTSSARDQTFESGYQSNEQSFQSLPDGSSSVQRTNRQWGPNDNDFQPGNSSLNTSNSSGQWGNNATGSNASAPNQWRNALADRGSGQRPSQPRNMDTFRNTNTPATNPWNNNAGGYNAPAGNQWNTNSGGYNAPASNSGNSNAGGYNAPAGNPWNNNAGGYNAPAGNRWNDNNNPGRYNAAASNQAGANSGDNDDKQCNCGIPARKFTVQKETPNKGRQFYGCSKPMSDPARCQFFCWADAGPSSSAGGPQSYGSNSSSNNFNDYGRNSNTFPSRNNFRNPNTSYRARRRGNSSTSGRRCGNCRQEGHNRNNCPANNEEDENSA